MMRSNGGSRETTAAIASRAATQASTVPSACCADTAIVGASPVVASWSSSANAAAAASRVGGIGGTFSATIRTTSAASTASRRSLRGQPSDASLPRWMQRPASSNSAHGAGRDRDGGAASRTRNVFIRGSLPEHYCSAASFQCLPDDRGPRAFAPLEQRAGLRTRVALACDDRDQKVFAADVESGFALDACALRQPRTEVGDARERLLRATREQRRQAG